MKKYDGELYIKFYDSCVPVVGANSGVIYDIHRGEIHFFPKLFVEILLKSQNKKLKYFFNNFKNKRAILEEYLNYLVDSELIFLTKTPKLFIGLNTEFRKPFLLDVIILEIDFLSREKRKLIQEPALYGCKELILVTKEELQKKHIDDVLDYVMGNKVEVIKIITKYSPTYNTEYSLKKDPRLREILVYDAPFNRNIGNFKFVNYGLPIIMNRKIESIQDFIVNTYAFIESLNHNLFFNRKIYIDNNDNIKHYFSEDNGFAKLNGECLDKIIDKPSFKGLWNITKDQIEVCRDCEFRFICPDNRVPIKRKNKDLYFHKTDCNYNPYTSKWQNSN